MHQAQNKYIFFSIILLLFPLVSRADTDFDYNNIISDDEAQNYSSMSQVQIRDFLQAKNSILANYWYEGNNPAPSELATGQPDDKFFKQRSAAEIIWNAAQEARINPQFILTTIQKEMGLIEDPSPSENALAFAMGYGCPDSGGCSFRFKGFGKQIRSGTLQFRYYIDNIEEYNHKPGLRSCVDDYTPYVPCTNKGTLVQPVNRITAAMYVYTPHINGNKLFRALWDKYGFGNSTPSNGENLTGVFPEGALVRAKDGADTASVYLIHNNLKLPFASMNALISRYDPLKVLAAPADELVKYQTGNIIKFANYSILENTLGQKYLIDGLQKRLIASDVVFRTLGFSHDEVVPVDQADLDLIADGLVIDNAEFSPFGQLLKDMTSGQLYYVKNGQAAAIIDPSIVKINFSGQKAKIVSSKIIAKYEMVGPVKLVDGTLIKMDKDTNVYVIAAGQRRLIPDAKAFEGFGYNWGNIIKVPNKVFNLHGLGQPLSI